MLVSPSCANNSGVWTSVFSLLVCGCWPCLSSPFPPWILFLADPKQLFGLQCALGGMPFTAVIFHAMFSLGNLVTTPATQINLRLQQWPIQGSAVPCDVFSGESSHYTSHPNKPEVTAVTHLGICCVRSWPADLTDVRFKGKCRVLGAKKWFGKKTCWCRHYGGFEELRGKFVSGMLRLRTWRNWGEVWHGVTKEDQEGSVKMAVYPEQQDC